MSARRYVEGSYPRRCSCGEVYSKEQWLALPDQGTMPVVRPYPACEIRTCPACGSSGGAEYWPDDYSEADIAEGRRLVAEEAARDARDRREALEPPDELRQFAVNLMRLQFGGGK